MKSLRSVEEIPFHPVRKKSSEIAARILGMVDALNMAKEVRICYRNQMKDQKLYLDEDLFLEAVSYTHLSGSSVGIAIAAGSAALLLQWIIQDQGAQASSSQIRNILILGTRRNPGIEYPNRLWGYGTMDLYHTFEEIRQL